LKSLLNALLDKSHTEFCFTLGPFRFVDSYGARKLADKILELRDLHGEHFEAAPMLLDYAKQGKTFHSK
jgi:hypothetical protein